MAAEITEHHLKVYCPTHKVSFSVLEASRIVCELGGETLAGDFPYEAFWEYCCDCQNVWPSNLDKGDESSDRCLVCNRKTSRRYLCHHCKLLSIKSDDTVGGKPFTLLPGGLPHPSCPGCSRTAPTLLSTHDCYAVYTTYVTARAQCPFCNELIPDGISETGERHESSSASAEQMGETPPDMADGSAGQDGANGHSATAGLRSRFWNRLGRMLQPRARRWVKSHKGRMELIGLIGFLLTAGGFILSFVGFPALYARLAWYGVKWTTEAPVLKSIECQKREVREGESVLLKAIFEHQNGLKHELNWSSSAGRIEGNGPDVMLNTTGITLQAVPLKVTVSLKMMDDYGRSDARDLDVYVVPVGLLNNSPILKTIKCNCNTQEVLAGESVSLTAIAEDPDGDQLAYEWRSSTGQINGQGESAVLTTTAINPQSSAPVKITLTVNDNRGRSVSNDIVINVVPRQTAKGPKEAATPSPEPQNSSPILVMLQPEKSVIEAGERVKLEAIATDPNNDKLIYEWTSSKGQVEGGGPSIVLNTAGLDPSHDLGRVIVTLTIRDGRGASASGNAMVTIVSTPTPKDARPSPSAPPVAPLLLYPNLWP
jgi:hypothetical protein